jgi:hypothetical protein
MGFSFCSSSAAAQFMVFGKTFSGAVALLAVYAGKLTTLQSPFLLRLPGGARLSLPLRALARR